MRPFVSASKALRFIAALTFLYSLQTAMLTTFDGSRGTFAVMLNLASGAAAIIVGLITSLRMICFADKETITKS